MFSWGLEACILTICSLSLRPTDEVGEDGWQLFLYGHELDITKIAQSEELVFETIASLVPTEITFTKVVWMSDFRCALCFCMCRCVLIGLFQGQYSDGE
jgi:hypothetical protein